MNTKSLRIELEGTYIGKWMVGHSHIPKKEKISKGTTIVNREEEKMNLMPFGENRKCEKCNSDEISFEFHSGPCYKYNGRRQNE